MDTPGAVGHGACRDEPAYRRSPSRELPSTDHLPDALHTHTQDVRSFMHAEHLVGQSAPRSSSKPSRLGRVVGHFCIVSQHFRKRNTSPTMLSAYLGATRSLWPACFPAQLIRPSGPQKSGAAETCRLRRPELPRLDLGGRLRAHSGDDGARPIAPDPQVIAKCVPRDRSTGGRPVLRVEFPGADK